MIAFAASLLGSSVGRWVVGVALALGAAYAAYRVIKASGAKDEAAKQAAQASLDAINVLTVKVHTDETLRQLSPAARRERLRARAIPSDS